MNLRKSQKCISAYLHQIQIALSIEFIEFFTTQFFYLFVEPFRKPPGPKTKQHYPAVKSKTDSGLKLPTANNNKKYSHHHQGQLWRSNSSLDLKPKGRSFKRPQSFPLRRIQSSSKLEIKEKEPAQIEQIVVNYAYFEKYRKKNLKLRHNHQSPRNKSSNGSLLLDSSNEQQRSPKPILRKSNRFFNNTEDDKALLDQQHQDVATSEPAPPSSFTSPQQQAPTNNNKSPKQNTKNKKQQQQDPETSSPSKETTINGIPLSKIQQRQKVAVTGSHSTKKQAAKKPNTLKLKQTSSPKDHQASSSSSPKKSSIKADSPKKSNTNNATINNNSSNNGSANNITPKTTEELEKEGARNFARCLLGILPNVLKATEPSAADELLQQFSSDVCEAVTCMTLKRKNVPNFGTVRTLEISRPGDDSEKPATEKDPSLNAECVYKAVYQALKLSYELNQTGYYTKAGATPHISQVRFSYK